MLIYPQFDFAAPPCVYAHWFSHVCAKSGLCAESNFPGPFKPSPNLTNGRMVLSIIRHPMTWLYAYFDTLKAKEIRVPEIDIFRSCYQGSQNRFPVFVDSYLRKCPGAITRMYQAYHATQVLRVEDLPGSAIELLQSVDIDASCCASYVFPGECGWMHDRDLRRLIVKAEWDFCLEYDYW